MATSIPANSKIKFKHGTQEHLNALRNMPDSIEVGAFYLTNDTHRMYIGIQGATTKEIVSVNEGIIKYTAAPPPAGENNAGQFAYLTTSNILCVSNGQSWIQLNYNTDTLYDYEGIVGASGDEDNHVTIKTTLTPKDSSDTGDFDESLSDASDFSFAVEGKDGIIVKAVAATADSDPVLEIYGTTIGCAVENDYAVIQMYDNAGNAVEGSGFTVEAGDNITISESTDGTGFNIKADNTTLDTLFTHSEIPEDKKGFTIFAEDTAGNKSGGTINPKITYGNTAQTVEFEDGIATLNVYTKEEVDSLRTAFDAMEYRGVVTSMPSDKEVKKGYTWKAGGEFEVVDVSGNVVGTVYAGDLIIANVKDTKTEDDNGYIAAENINWEIVPSGNEDTTYTVTTTSAGIQISEKVSADADATPIGGIEVVASGVLTATQSTPNTGFKKIEITHNEISAGTGTSTGNVNKPALESNQDLIVGTDEVKVIDASQGTNGFDFDEYGHITKVYTKTYTIHDTNAELSDAGAVCANVENSNKASVTLSTSLRRANSSLATKKSAIFEIGSSHNNVKVGASGTTGVAIDLVWDSFSVELPTVD